MTYNNKREVLEHVFNTINQLQSDLVISSAHDDGVSEMITGIYSALESTKMAARGFYHTNTVK